MFPDDVVRDFATLFQGYESAYGTGKGGWVHSKPSLEVFRSHLEGRGNGLGIGPLTPDGKCGFAAIDLDRPDFDLAQEMMKLLPGTSWLERSRSGNAHVLVFFSKPLEAWVARGIMLKALLALGERGVEVFPKTDRLLPGMVGNYLNLPYFGNARPVVSAHVYWDVDKKWHMVDYIDPPATGLALESFVSDALDTRNDPQDWWGRAKWLGIESPEERTNSGDRKQFGEAPTLHLCAQHLIEHRDDNPVVAGHRASVYFALAKMLANWSEIDDDEALSMMTLVNDSSPDPISVLELGRIYQNVLRGQFTSTGCDDALFQPYRHPNCRIGE